MFATALLLGLAQAGAAKPAEPTEYVVPATGCYSGEELVLERQVGDQRIRIAGTIDRPRAGPAAPAILLITGSGDHVRDQMISGVPMFGLIGDFLSRAGYTVVRVDARGFGGSTVNGENLPGPRWMSITSDQRYSDMNFLLDELGKRPDIGSRGFILLGHSEGAMIASRLAADRPDVALTVMLSNSTAPGNEVFAMQRANFARRDGPPPEVVEKLKPLLLELAALASRDPGNDARFERLAAKFEEAQKAMKEPLFPRGFLEFHRSRTPWHSWFMGYDPYPDLSRIVSPVFAVYGGSDDATDWRIHAPILGRALAAAGNSDHSILVLPEQDHFFLEFEGRRVDRHPYGKTRIATELRNALLDELQRRFGSAAYCSA